MPVYDIWSFLQSSGSTEEWLCHCIQWCRPSFGYRGMNVLVHHFLSFQWQRATNDLIWFQIYAARETNVWNVSGKDLATSIIGPPSEYIPSLVHPNSVFEFLEIDWYLKMLTLICMRNPWNVCLGNSWSVKILSIWKTKTEYNVWINVGYMMLEHKLGSNNKTSVVFDFLENGEKKRKTN